MKKLLFLTILGAFTITKATTQILQKSVPAAKQNVIIKNIPNQPPPPPPPTSTNKNAGTSNQNTPVYTLTAARVNIRTGADNKEYPSGVIVWLFSLGGGFTFYQPAENLRNGMRIDSNTEFGLENDPNYDTEFR